MIILKNQHYLNLILIILRIILINSSQPNDFKTEINRILNDNTISTQDLLAALSRKGGIYDTDGEYGYQISFIENQAYTDFQGTKFPQVNVTNECKDIIKSLSENISNVIVTKIFKLHSFNIDSNNYHAGITDITDVIYYQFFPFKNNKIEKSSPVDISNVCGESVVIFSPLYIEDVLKNKFVAVAGQNPKTEFEYLRNYDIFDPDSKIYKDICYPITFSNASENIFSKDSFKNYDISLEQRKKYYFPGNLQLCPEECTYLGTDKDTVSAMCQCDFDSKFTLTGTQFTIHTEYSSFTFDEEKFNKTKKDNYLTIEVLKCIKLPFTKSGFKNNYGSYIIIALICIILLSYIILGVSGKYHLLSVLELLYNSNIKSMNYIKGNNLGNFSPTNFQNPYDTKSNNLLLSSQRGISTNGLLMSGSNYLNGPNNFNKANQINVAKKNNNNIQIVNKKGLNKNKAKKEKDDLIKVDEIKENDLESEKNSLDKDKTDTNSMNKDKNDIANSKLSDKNDKKDNKKQDQKKNETEEEEEEEEDEQNKSKQENKDNNNKDQSKDEEGDEEEEEEEENDKKANPPKKKHTSIRKPNGSDNINGNENQNGEGEEEPQKNTKKKKKEKTPIEIALNVKELRDMMFNNMPQDQKKSNENGNPKNTPPKNNQPQNNGFNFNPFMNPMSFLPPPYPNYPFNNNEDKIRKEYEDKARQRELEFQKELAEMREKDRRREMEDLRERERQRQRELDYERERRQRDDLYRSLDRYDRGYDRDRDRTKYYDKDRNDEIEKEREEIQKMKEKLQKEYSEKQNKDREKDLELQKELSKIKDSQREKEIEFEKELLKQKELLNEKFEKEKRDIIEKKDKEIERLREEKDREIQRLKEDKDREIKYLKEDMDREKKSQNEKLKRKEKEFKKEKQKLKEIQKMTSNSFFMNPNSTMQQQIIDINNSLKYNEKIETPQIVVPIDSIFTDQELNAMDFNNSCMFDKRTLCQVYGSFINRKQPLFFLFNYNSSSSGSVSTFQINYKSIKFIIFSVELMIYLFFYCSFFGSKSITHIFFGTFNLRKKCIFGIILSPICMIVKSVIHHFVYDNMNMKIAEIKMRCYTNFIVGKKPEEIKVNEFKDFWESEEDQQKNVKEEKKEEIEDIQEIENDNLPEEEKIRRKEKYEKRKLKSLIKDLITLFKRKIIISVIIIIPCLFIEWYYVSAFCAVYKNSQLDFFSNILISFAFSNVIPFVYCLVPTIFRQDAVKEESRFAFFLAQIFKIL